jgi:hypothetical protein
VALYANTTGSYNTAVGAYALGANTTGSNNTASGDNALAANTTGTFNTASGASALSSTTTGYRNTADGYESLYANTGGFENSATGYKALFSNTGGSANIAYGYGSLYSNTLGINNVATGWEALYATTGSNNIGIGHDAGYNLTSGSNDIDIGNEGVAAESGIIRIGTAGTQTATYIAGIQSSQVTGAAVYVTASGQLGVLASSERYKTAVTPLGADTDRLDQLRPVSFHLKSDPAGPVQYGLIAEEVAKVYPELVIRDAAGRVQGVRYDELAPMLLNEVQKQRQTIAAQDQRAAAQDAKVGQLAEQLATMQMAVLELESKYRRVAQR